MKRVAFGLAMSFLAAGCIPAEVSRLEFEGTTCQEAVESAPGGKHTHEKTAEQAITSRCGAAP